MTLKEIEDKINSSGYDNNTADLYEDLVVALKLKNNTETRSIYNKAWDKVGFLGHEEVLHYFKDLVSIK